MRHFTHHLAPVLCCLIISTNSTFAQKNLAILNFEDGLCRYKGYYDKDQFTEKKLEDTFLLSSMMLYFDGDDLTELEQNYTQIKNDLRGLNLVNRKVFTNARDSMLRYMQESYEIQKLRLAAIEDPGVLKSKFQDDSTVRKYTEALIAGGDSLLNVYGELVHEQMENNAHPEVLKSKYEENLKQDECYEIAFDQVLAYGWWNSVNHLIYHFQHDGTLEEQFLKLFERVVTVDCDE